MHELQITKEIVKIAVNECLRHQVLPDNICVDIGRLTTYQKEPILYYFELLKQSEPGLNNARLTIRSVEGGDVRVRDIEVKNQQAGEPGQ